MQSSNPSDDPLLATLTAALAQATTGSDRVKVLLAVELRKHQLCEEAKYRERHGALRIKYVQAQEAHRQSTDSVERDRARVARGFQQPASGFQLLVRAATGAARDQRGAKEALDFSLMMADGTRRDVDGALKALKACEQEHAETVRRLRVETRLACMACQSLLEAVTEDAGTMSIVELDENDVEVAAPSPVLPQPQSRTLPQPQPRMLPPPQSRVLPPPPPIPPMALQKAPPKPLTKAPPVPVGLRPFVITAEKGSPHEPAAVLTRHSGPVRAFVLGPLRASVAAALRGQGIDADIHAGEAGFGADAYVSVYVRADKQRLRVPVAIVDAFGTATHYGNAIQENLTGNARALAECVGAYRRPDPRWACDYRAVESAVRRLMLLISAEALAGNAGVLVAGEGALTVRRTAQMAVAVGALSPQPAAAIARLVASIAANSPQKNIVFDPPVFL